jgi:hypothetical protein
MVENTDESPDLKNVPVIAPITQNSQNQLRRWVAKNSGRRVFLLKPYTSMDVNERQAMRVAIEQQGWLVTTPMSYAELMDDYLGHHESKAIDLYGSRTYPGTRGQLNFPHVRITELLFTGKETVLQDELERGLVSQQEVYRVMIQSECDPMAELLIKVLRLLPKAETKRLGFSRRIADRINEDEKKPVIKNVRSDWVNIIAQYLVAHYPDEVGDTQGEDILRTFIDCRSQIFDQWEEIKPGLLNLSTKQIIEIVGCSRGTAKNIKFGKTKPRIETIKRILNARPVGIIPLECEIWQTSMTG